MDIKTITNSFINRSVSVALAGFLMLGGASELNAHYLDIKQITQKSQYKSVRYVKLCNNIYETNLLLSHFFLLKGEYLSDTAQRQRAKKHIKTLQKVIQTAQKRITNDTHYKEDNQKVFYSSVALKNILEEVCDEDFMRLVGVARNLENFDIFAYAKGVLKAANES